MNALRIQIEDPSIQGRFINRSNDFFTKAAKKSKDQTLTQMAELNKIYNLALRGNSKKAMKRMAKLKLEEGEETGQFSTFLRAYCYKCQGQQENFESEKKKLTDKALLASLENQ